MIVISDKVPNDFVYDYLPKKLFRLIIKDIDRRKFDAFDEYIHEELKLDVNCLDIIKIALSRLDVKHLKNVYIINISDTYKIDRYTDRQLIKLIDYGNIDMKGAMIVEKAFNYVDKHKEKILDEYLGD